MKKIFIITMILALSLSFAACTDNTTDTGSGNENPPVSQTPVPTPTPTPTPEPTPTPIPELTGSLEDIIKKMHEVIDPELAAHTVLQEVTADNSKYFLGTDEINYVEALAAEPMIGVMPHSIVVLRLEEGADVEAVVNLIKENADGRKWICVGVDDDKVLVNSIGHTIALVIDENSESIMEAFLSQGS